MTTCVGRMLLVGRAPLEDADLTDAKTVLDTCRLEENSIRLVMQLCDVPWACLRVVGVRQHRAGLEISCELIVEDDAFFESEGAPLVPRVGARAVSKAVHRIVGSSRKPESGEPSSLFHAKSTATARHPDRDEVLIAMADLERTWGVWELVHTSRPTFWYSRKLVRAIKTRPRVPATGGLVTECPWMRAAVLELADATPTPPLTGGTLIVCPTDDCARVWALTAHVLTPHLSVALMPRTVAEALVRRLVITTYAECAMLADAQWARVVSCTGGPTVHDPENPEYPHQLTTARRWVCVSETLARKVQNSYVTDAETISLFRALGYLEFPRPIHVLRAVLVDAARLETKLAQPPHVRTIKPQCTATIPGFSTAGLEACIALTTGGSRAKVVIFAADAVVLRTTLHTIGRLTPSLMAEAEEPFWQAPVSVTGFWLDDTACDNDKAACLAQFNATTGPAVIGVLVNPNSDLDGIIIPLATHIIVLDAPMVGDVRECAPRIAPHARHLMHVTTAL